MASNACWSHRLGSKRQSRSSRSSSILVDPVQHPWAVAIIAPQDEVYWVARTYEVLRAGSPETVRVFRDAVEAEGWARLEFRNDPPS